MDYVELRAKAKELGIPTYGLKKNEIESLVKATIARKKDEVETQPVAEAAPAEVAPALEIAPERLEQAKQARIEGRSRRGGATLGKDEMKLDRPEYRREGFNRRWFKDEGGRLSSAYANDYDYVLDAAGKKISQRSGTNRDGSARYLFLMEKRLDWHKEDQLKKRKTDIDKEQLLKKGLVAGSDFNTASQGLDMYQPSEGVRINNSVIIN